MAKILVVGIFLGVILYAVVVLAARYLVEYGKELQRRKEVKEHEKQ